MATKELNIHNLLTFKKVLSSKMVKVSLLYQSKGFLPFQGGTVESQVWERNDSGKCFFNKVIRK